MQPLAVSFLVDAAPKFRLQGFTCLGSLLATGTARPGQIVVHLVNDHPDWYRDALARTGVTVCDAAPAGTAASPYCNKLVQMKSRPLQQAATVVLLDADVVVTRNLSAVLPGVGVRAKTADTAVPGLPVLTTLARRAGLLRAPLETVPTDFGHGDTARGYCNGGVYLFDATSFRRLGPYWLKWTGWTLGQETLLGPAIKHADQIGFLLALLDTGLPLHLLPLAMNYPSHLKDTTYAPAHDLTPDIIHYHDRLDADGLLLPRAMPQVSGAIARINALLRAFHETFSPPQLFRQFRDTGQSGGHAAASTG